MGVHYVNVVGEINLLPRGQRYHAKLKGHLVISAVIADYHTEPVHIAVYLRAPNGDTSPLGILAGSRSRETGYAVFDAPIEFQVDTAGTYWIQAYLDELLLHEIALPVVVHRSAVPDDPKLN